MEVKFEKAKPEDYDDATDFGNYVFSHDDVPRDGPTLLPKIHKPEYFMEGIHYLAREGGRIKAAAGAYPVDWEFQPDIRLPGRGIGMVTVHPYSRSRGLMKELMNWLLDDIKRDGIVFAFLTGLRQRYEYFGFSLTGSIYTFVCNKYNIRHVLGSQWDTKLSLKLVGPGDKALLDKIYDFHQAKISRLHRQKDKFFDILSSWKAKTFAVTNGERFEGYFISREDRTGEVIISEVNLFDYSQMPEVLGLFMRQTEGMKEPLRINAGPHEREKISALSSIAETYNQSPVSHFAIFDYLRFTEPFLKLASKIRNLADGSFVFQIEGGPRLRMAVAQGVPSLKETSDPSELSLKHLEAQQFLFSPLVAETFPIIGKNTFLQSLLPLPLFFESADGI